MDVTEFLFSLSFLFILGITLIKIFNLMHKGQKYDIKISFLLFITFTIAWGVSFFIALLNYTTPLYSLLSRFGHLFFVFNGMVLLFEIFWYIAANAEKPAQAFNALEARLNK